MVTLWLESLDGERLSFRSGQFNMLSAFGVGEIAISISGSPSDLGPLRHTVRDVGAVSRRAVFERGGRRRWRARTLWHRLGRHAARHDAGDTVIVAGGIGLAPLRGAVEELAAARRERCRAGLRARGCSRTGPARVLGRYGEVGEQRALSSSAPSTVPHPGGMDGSGLVTTLLANAGFDPRTVAC